ncbi:MAG: hypothetical protein AAF958_19935 [Planctomycetota bacterium]
MSDASTPIPWKHVRNVLVMFAPLWVGAMGLFGIVGVMYALLSTDIYTSRIGLVVRDEATSSSIDRMGRFPSQTELKAAQETILEMVQNPETVAAALREIGPPHGGPDPDYPSREAVDDASEAVNLLAPQGSEFGNTEVVYLQAKSTSRDRAEKYSSAMYNALATQLRHVRKLRADSIIEELTRARDLAKVSLQIAMDELATMEVQFGEDLGEMRNLRDTISGEGANRRALEELTANLQTAELELSRMQSLEAILRRGAEDASHLLIAGPDIVASQPSLQRLKDGLIDAQLRSSSLAGTLTANNPKRRAAKKTEDEIRTRLQAESDAAVRSMQPTIRLQEELVRRLQTRQAKIRQRLDSLAKYRTEYARIDSEVKNRTEQLDQAQRSLAEAEAARSAALDTNLIAKFGPAQTGERPIGPGGLTITAGASVAGLIFGLGVVFLVAPGPAGFRQGRRWSDYLTYGRRRSDQIAAVASQNPVPPQNVAPQQDRRQRPPAAEATAAEATAAEATAAEATAAEATAAEATAAGGTTAKNKV